MHGHPVTVQGCGGSQQCYTVNDTTGAQACVDVPGTCYPPTGGFLLAVVGQSFSTTAATVYINGALCSPLDAASAAVYRQTDNEAFCTAPAGL
jgi:hypothetical protein